MNLTEYPEQSLFCDPANKLTAITGRNFQKKLFKNESSDSPSLYFVDKNLATMHISLFLIRSDPWNKILLKKIDQLISAGIA
jgi:hypothetical protein